MSNKLTNGLTPSLTENLSVRRAVHVALIAGAVTASTYFPNVYAQTAIDAQPSPSALQEVVVTGSRIRRADLDTPAPVTVVTHDDIVNSGKASVGDILQSLPALTGSALNAGSNNGGDGSVRADIRGFGEQRTLVLINGRRVVNGSGTAGPGDSVDLNMIPVSMIERIEVLKDGGSVIYGADAITGVVNIITRQHIEGLETSADYGSTTHNDGHNYSVHLASGFGGDKGHISVGGDFTETEGVLQGARDYSSHAQFLQCVGADVPLCPTQRFSGGSSAPPTGFISVPDGNALGLAGGVYTADSTVSGGYRPFINSGPGNDRYNFATVNYLSTPNKREQFWLQADHDLFANVTAFAEAIYYHRESNQQLAPLPYFATQDPGAPLTGVGNPDAAGLTGVSAGSFYNTFGADLFDVRLRFVAAGDRAYFQTVDTWRSVTGLKGKFGESWNWEVSFNFGHNGTSEHETGQFLGANLALALGPSFQDPTGAVVCGTPGNVIAGCVPLDILHGQPGITQAMVNYLTIPVNDYGVVDEKDSLAFVSGDLFSLPAGALAVSAGFESRAESGYFHFDSNKVAGAITGGQSKNTDGGYSVNEAFVEAQIPILKDAPGAQVLELDGGGRFSRFSNFGSTNNYKAELKWKPIKELTVRATYNQVFRAPTINELFQGHLASFNTGQDPCGNSPTAAQQVHCAANGVPGGVYVQTNGQPEVTQGGNANLRPELGFTKTVGLVFSPSYVAGLSATVDYFDVYLKNVIQAPGASDLLAGCANTGDAQFCDKVHRLPDGEVHTLDGENLNLGLYTAKGYDAQLNFNFETPIGRWRTYVAGTYLAERDILTFPGNPIIHDAGTFDSTTTPIGAAYPKVRANLGVSWLNGPWMVGYNARYIGRYAEVLQDINANGGALQPDASGFIREVGSVLYHDIQGSYSLNDGTTVSAKIFNVGDKSPPFVESGFSANTDSPTYDLLGRVYLLRVSHNF